jgi:hypothetical protein
MEQGLYQAVKRKRDGFAYSIDLSCCKAIERYDQKEEENG